MPNDKAAVTPTQEMGKILYIMNKTGKIFLFDTRDVATAICAINRKKASELKYIAIYVIIWRNGDIFPEGGIARA